MASAPFNWRLFIRALTVIVPALAIAWMLLPPRFLISDLRVLPGSPYWDLLLAGGAIAWAMAILVAVAMGLWHQARLARGTIAASMLVAAVPVIGGVEFTVSATLMGAAAVVLAGSELGFAGRPRIGVLGVAFAGLLLGVLMQPIGAAAGGLCAGLLMPLALVARSDVSRRRVIISSVALLGAVAVLAGSILLYGWVYDTGGFSLGDQGDLGIVARDVRDILMASARVLVVMGVLIVTYGHLRSIVVSLAIAAGFIGFAGLIELAYMKPPFSLLASLNVIPLSAVIAALPHARPPTRRAIEMIALCTIWAVFALTAYDMVQAAR